jgi:hypothetical protein
VAKSAESNFKCHQASAGEKSTPAQACSLVICKEKKQAVGHKKLFDR